MQQPEIKEGLQFTLSGVGDSKTYTLYFIEGATCHINWPGDSEGSYYSKGMVHDNFERGLWLTKK